MPNNSPAQLRAKDKYNKKVYESIGLRVKKGTREKWREEAEKRGLSLAALIVKAVEEYLQQQQTP